MSEALYLTTNILLGLFAIAKFTSTVYAYLLAVYNAPKARDDLRREFYLRGQTLINLRGFIHKEPQTPELQWFDKEEAPLGEYIQELSYLHESVAKKKKIEHWKWPLYREAEIMAEVEKYERLEAIFMLALSINQSSLAKAVETNKDQAEVASQTEVASQKTESWVGSTETTVETKTTPDPKGP